MPEIPGSRPALVPTALAAVERVNRLAYSVPEAAQALGVSRAKIYELLSAGTLSSVKLDGRRLIRPEALAAMLDALESA